MIKNFIETIKLSKLSYLLEIIELRDFKSKIKAFNKIKSMKLSKEMGMLILDSANFEHKQSYSDFNISLSLISLVFKDYYDEYTDKIKEIFPKLTEESKFEVLNLLTSTTNHSAITLYKDLILKYGKEFDEIPVSFVELTKDTYDILFPDLFKALKFKNIKRNNIILLINDFLNLGLLQEKDIKKNKKIISDCIVTILKEGVNFKFKKDEFIMQNKEYLNLRIFLEAITNIEYYVSTKDTKNYLEKLLKKKDNQLKLFILENYVKKGKDISKISLNTIAKDNLSRYPLYSFLKFYNLERLMPKKYNNNLALSESDLYINYCIDKKYSSIPENMEFIREEIIDNYKYYIYKFETKFNYNEEVVDIATDYILKSAAVDKTIKENGKVKYVGISGGFNKDIDPSTIEKAQKILLVKKYTDDIEKTIKELIPKKEIIKQLEKVKEKVPKKNFIKEKLEELKNKQKTKKIKPEKIKKEKPDKKIKKVIEEIPTVPVVEEDEYKEPSIIRRIFSFNTLLILLCLGFAGSIFILVSYVNGMDLLNLKSKTNNYINLNIFNSSEIKDERYKEINYDAIFNQEQKEYYVIFYNKKAKSTYHPIIKTLLDNNYTIYYVNTKKEENKPIFGGNSTGFTISEDTILKVNDKEYEFYVVGKKNVLNEMKSYVDEINKKKAEEIKQKKAEEDKKKKEVSLINELRSMFVFKNKNVCASVIMKDNIAFSEKKIYNQFISCEKEE